MIQEDKYNEEWKLVVGDTDWILDKKEAHILRDAIKSGNRGMVVFDDLVVNIPFIKEFYLKRRVLKPEYQLPEPDYIISEETPAEAEQRRRQWAEWKKKAVEASKPVKEPPKPLTGKAFEKRKQQLLKQAKELLKHG